MVLEALGAKKDYSNQQGSLFCVTSLCNCRSLKETDEVSSEAGQELRRLFMFFA